MSLKARFLAVMGLVLVLFLGSALWLRELSRQGVSEVLQSTRQDRQELLERTITLIGSTLQTFAVDYSLWDDMIAFSQHPTKEWAAVNIDASLPTFNAVGAWVFRADGTLAYSVANLPGFEPEIVGLFDTAAIRAITQHAKMPHFFVAMPAGLLEVRGAPLQPSNDYDRQSPPQGWFLVARRWDEKFINTLAHLNESEALLARPGEALEFPARTLSLRVQHILPDHSGQPLRILHLDYKADRLNSLFEADGSEFALFVTYGLLSIGLVGFVLVFWVLRPLELVSRSLADESPAAILPLLGRRDEFGRVARLVQTAAEQRASLQTMLAERARLGRDLHDSVIQTIYACGMGVMTARLTLRTDPAASERTLAQIGTQFNDVIHDLRGFITGLEPELLRHRTFREAVDAVVESFPSLLREHTAIDLDPTLAERLTPHQQVNILHILRECISNALRHGQATGVTATLRPTGKSAVLEIADNGCGFTPGEASRRGGKGLANLAERTKDLGGTLAIESAPGTNTRIRITIPTTRA